MTPKFELELDFCIVYLIAKFRHSKFNRSEVIVLTNKQTDAAENIHLAALSYAGGQKCRSAGIAYSFNIVHCCTFITTYCHLLN